MSPGTSPSLRHELLAYAVPRLRRSRDLAPGPEAAAAERERIERWHSTLDRRLPTGRGRGFARRFEATTQTLTGPDGSYPVHVITPRSATGTDTDTSDTVYYLHGGGYVAPIDTAHVRYATRLATLLGARVVMPDYPLAPEHTWRASHEAMVDDLARRCAAGRVVLAGDSAGGGLALALAQGLRDRGGPQPSHLLLVSPWVDLTASTPATRDLDAVDPWLWLSKLTAYAGWWAGGSGPDDLARPEVSPALGDLDGLPPALMLCGTRDLLHPGCRLLADRAAASDWSLTYLEAPDLIHVFPILPGLPEARTAWRHTEEFLR